MVVAVMHGRRSPRAMAAILRDREYNGSAPPTATASVQHERQHLWKKPSALSALERRARFHAAAHNSETPIQRDVLLPSQTIRESVAHAPLRPVWMSKSFSPLSAL